MPAREDLPSTLRRSPDKAQETWAKTHDAAVESYGEGERAHRTAFASLKHSFEKVGDHWEPKAKRGPSDPQAARGRPDLNERGGRRSSRQSGTAAGVDANAPKAHLMEVATRLNIPGRSRMTKDELVKAIKKANNRSTAQARKSSGKRS